MSSTFSALSASLVARQIARVSRPRPWIVPAPVAKPVPVVPPMAVPPPVVKPVPVDPSMAGPSSTLSSLPKSVIARVTARVSRPQSQTLSTVSSFASSKRSIVRGRPSPVPESLGQQTTLSTRASARASRDRPWLNPRAGSIAAKVSKSTSTTAKWIRSQAVPLPQAAPRRPPQASRQASSIPIRHSPTSDASMSIPAPRIVIPKRRTAPTGSRQAVRSSSTLDNRAALQSSSSGHPQQVVPSASPDKSIAEIVREAFAFDISKFRAEVRDINERLESNRKWLRRARRKPVTFDDNPTVIEHPKWIEREHVFGGPPRMLGYILAWRPIDNSPYEHTLVWGTDPETSNFDHTDCENPDCHRRAKDLYMQDYEEWTAPTFTTMSE